jgi:phenylpropionate dioxygenase-like ring-hydroxylating dioxygenase large terminal subunit
MSSLMSRGAVAGEWLHSSALPHRLPPQAYYAEDHHQLEQTKVFADAWHPIATVHELAAGPIRRRLGEQTLRITLLQQGEKPVVEVLELAHPASRRGLREVRHEELGAFVFVTVGEDAPALVQSLDEHSVRLLQQPRSRFLRQVAMLEQVQPCNWKVPLENVLESYHVAALHNNWLARHPELFKVFSGNRSPGPAHRLLDSSTSYFDSLGADSTLYRQLLRRLAPLASTDYIHHHQFPNLIIGHTAIFHFVQTALPLTSTSSLTRMWLLLELGRAPSQLEQVLSGLTSNLARRFIERVMQEDAAVYAAVQRGLASSRNAGVLGTREERIHQFHNYLINRVEAA